MCGQENKSMSVQETVGILTQECIELRRIIATTSDDKEKEKLILKHIISKDKSGLHVNDFQKGLEWFNVSEGLSLSNNLSGKIVILDFFTYCCINCMHILPDLDALEKKYKIEDGLVIIGVHSAKFSNERESNNILSAVQRYNIQHPVVNDSKLSMWRNIGIVCWPTLVILGPKAQPLAVLVGEGHRNELFIYLKVALSFYKSRNEISNHSLPLEPAQHLLSSSKKSLQFPGKVIGFSRNKTEKIIVSDTGNNRIIIMKPNGEVETIIGDYSPGFKDGDFETARFNSPQGLCARDNSIYVADNENHAIRRIDLENKSVETVAGTGIQGQDYQGGKRGREQALSSPWDVAIYEYKEKDKVVPVLLIAIAGTHQIWGFFIEDTVWWKNREYKAGTCAAIVGNGREANKNNSYPHASSLAQPSGLALAQSLNTLFFADSESSSIRKIDLKDGRVSAVAGADRNPTDLHNFGDIDGTGYSAKLQHPLGVTWDEKRKLIYVADTYNHKIKEIDLSGKCRTLFGDKKPTKDFTFNEPSGLGLIEDFLVIADTNNHCVKIINLEKKIINIVSELKDSERIDDFIDKTLDFNAEISNKRSDLIIKLIPKLKNNVEFTENAPNKWQIRIPQSWTAESVSESLKSPIKLKLPESDENEELSINLNFVICKKSQCIPRKITIIYRIHRKSGAPENVVDNRELEIF